MHNVLHHTTNNQHDNQIETNEIETCTAKLTNLYDWLTLSRFATTEHKFGTCAFNMFFCHRLRSGQHNTFHNWNDAEIHMLLHQYNIQATFFSHISSLLALIPRGSIGSDAPIQVLQSLNTAPTTWLLVVAVSITHGCKTVYGTSVCLERSTETNTCAQRLWHNWA